MSRISRTISTCFASTVVLLLATYGAAQTQLPVKLPADLQSLPEDVKTLQWQTIDLASLSPLEQSRSLLLMDHALSELSANVTAEADLMSAYIEKNKLGSDFANTPPPPAPKQLGFTDAQKVAVAMLRGPMKNSYYATELSDATPSSLASYAEMYQRTCARKWSEFDESRHQVRCMASYLGNSQKMADYDAWATAESAARQKEYDQKQQQQNAGPAQAPAGQPQPSQGQMQALAQQNQQLQQALGAAEYQQQAQAQQLAQSQQNTSDAQQQTAQAQQQTAQAQQQSTSSGYVAAVPTYGAYGSYGAYAAGAYTGAAAANANAANANKYTNQQKAAAGAGAYHASNNTWNRDSSYNSTAHAQTEQRMSSFHGTSSGGARGGARR